MFRLIICPLFLSLMSCHAHFINAIPLERKRSPRSVSRKQKQRLPAVDLDIAETKATSSRRGSGYRGNKATSSRRGSGYRGNKSNVFPPWIWTQRSFPLSSMEWVKKKEDEKKRKKKEEKKNASPADMSSAFLLFL